jgi:hypothetical protein
MLSCYKTTQLISLSQERPLAFNERASMRVHLVLCSICRRFNKNNATLSKAMREFAKQP